ncbi:MAG: hypothetical protein JHC95_14200 [Solirubrobacteraceae bacterium]|nr:hypothetical protein [Solirubrobacteraceae bacterium]
MRALACLATLAVCLLAAAAPAPAQSATTCPGTFQVLHHDEIGALKLAAGAYTVTATGVSCPEASKLFTRFLDDWDGNLPSPWKVDAKNSRFVQGSGPTSIRVALVKPASATSCAGTFAIYTPVTAAGLRIGLGQWALTVSGGLSCTIANQVFVQTADTNILPQGWAVNTATNTFTRGTQSFVAANTGSAPSGIGRTTTTRCPGTFTVRHDDKIGALRLPKGKYVISTLPSGAVSCPTASDMLKLFLERPSGNLPSPWKLNAQTATFTRGGSSGTGFHIEPASVTS